MVEKLTVSFQKAAVSLTPLTWHQTSLFPDIPLATP
jgi:hypothetical protein